MNQIENIQIEKLSKSFIEKIKYEDVARLSENGKIRCAKFEVLD